MSLNKRILLLLVLFNLSISQFKPDPYYPRYPNHTRREKMGEIEDNRIHILNEIRGKTNDVMLESRILKVKIEIYSVFVKILLSLNIVFFIIILSLLSYKVYLYIKGEKIEKLYKIRLSNINGKKDNNNLESQINNDDNNDKQNSLLNQELMNKSGIEAPSIEKYINTLE